MSTHTDDDDISTFVQDIDARKPLSRRDDSPAPSPPRHAREHTIREESESSDREVAPLAPTRARTVSAPFPMLATEGDVDERLREMNENFLESLQVFGPRKSSGSRSPVSTTAERSSSSRRAPLDPIAYTGGARRDGPLEGPRAGVLSALPDGIGLPPNYVRPRMGSTGSVRSGFSIASEEVIGRMDPEINSSDERRRSALGREFS